MIDTSQTIPPAFPDQKVAASEPIDVPSFESAARLDRPTVSSTLQQVIAGSSASPAVPATAESEAFAQLVHPHRPISSKKAARPRRAARARIEAPRKDAEHLRHPACDWCGRSNLGQAF
jgi:hypothetical protein